MIISTNNKHVTGGDDNDEFTIEARNVTLTTGDGDNYVDDNGTNSLIQTGEGDDTVRINDDSKNATVEVGDGDALIEVWSPNTTTIIFGDGDTSIDVCANTNLILDIGVNEDYELNFYNGATANVTLTDGEGSYTVRGTADANVFDYSDGDLVIISYGGEDLIRVRQKIGAAYVDGDDVCISVDGGGSITVKNGRSHALNVNGRKIVVGQYAKTPQEVIKDFMTALTQTKFRGMKAVDDAVKKSSPFKSVRDVIRHMVKDCKRIDDADIFLRDCCNIFVDSADTGAITGWDAGNSFVKDAESIVAERGAIKIFRGDSFTVNGLKVILPTKKLSAVEQNIVNGLFTWWIKDALNLIEQSYGKSLRFDNPNASTNEINVIFHRKGDALSSFAHLAEDDGRETEFDLKINLKTYGNINALDANGSVKGGDETFLDRTLAHELTHASMAANIRFYSELPAWLVEGAAELTHGISDENRDDLETLANDWDALEEILLNDSPDADDLEFDDIDQPAYAGGFMFLHYFAKQVAAMS